MSARIEKAPAVPVTVAAKVDYLRDPAHYPERPDQVELIQTHRSWVFLTDRHVYKFKKPVRLPFLDLSALASRHGNCLEEVRLNRRLAPDVYLGVVALVRKSDGSLALQGEGDAVEWLVKMRRLPRDRMLDRALTAGHVDADDVRRFARTLAQFYWHAAKEAVDPAAWPRRTAGQVLDNREALIDPRFRLPAEDVQTVAGRQTEFLAAHGEMLTRRVITRHIVEGHGDLRPEHVCLVDPPLFIDCLEFQRDLRILDPADELAYLALECELLGAPFVGGVLFDTYRALTGDRPDPRLIHFYQSHRAMLRAKLCAWHLLDDDVDDHGRWLDRAREYLVLAQGHVGPL